MSPKSRLSPALLCALILLAGGLLGFYRAFAPRLSGPESGAQPPAVATPGNTPPTPAVSSSIEIGIAYGTEKQRWMEEAVQSFNRTEAGRSIKVNLLPMGSLEGSRAVLNGDRSINVWAPAGTLDTIRFVRDWQAQNGKSPIVRGQSLALTPLVFVMWEDRHRAFVQKYGHVSLATLARAMSEAGGWNAIARKPEWGTFKWGQTPPENSNSGLAGLVLMGYHFRNKTRDLTSRDVQDPGFEKWLQVFARHSGETISTSSTGDLMREMVLKGPSAYDAALVYESAAVDFLRNAEGRWGKLHVTYPDRNVWNDNPYYVLEVPWSTPDQKQAATAFERFLLGQDMQKALLRHGFRPADPKTAILFGDNPLTALRSYGVQPAFSGIACAPPPVAVLDALTARWRQAAGAGDRLSRRSLPDTTASQKDVKYGMGTRRQPMRITDELKAKIDRWIQGSGRNQYGDPKDTVYAGGNPLFDERSPQPRDRYDYILSRHPELRDDKPGG